MAVGFSQLLRGARSPLGLAWPSALAQCSWAERSLAARRVCTCVRGKGASGWAHRLEREVKSHQAWNRRAATGFGRDFHLPRAPWHPAGRAETVLRPLRCCPGASHPLGMLLVGQKCSWSDMYQWQDVSPAPDQEHLGPLRVYLVPSKGMGTRLAWCDLLCPCPGQLLSRASSEPRRMRHGAKGLGGSLPQVWVWDGGDRGSKMVASTIIRRGGEHVTVGLHAQQSLTGCVLRAVGTFQRGNLSTPALFSPPVLFWIFHPSQICGPGMGSCKDLGTGKPAVGTGGC